MSLIQCNIFIGLSGTGKTDTIMAMATIFGNICKVINCSDGLDHQTFSQFLNGICQSKIWGLFTKFSRISQKTLSVISTLLFSMKWSLLGNKNENNVMWFQNYFYKILIYIIIH